MEIIRKSYDVFTDVFSREDVRYTLFIMGIEYIKYVKWVYNN